ncbi:MAG: glycosyltransferase [Spirochaetaceae bacterium]|nr:glycosyltransferase [Spirochaetaceae bacterium]
MTVAGALQWAVLALCASMLLTHATLATGVLAARLRDRRDEARRRRRPSGRRSAPPVSVVVAAMNEEQALPRLLDSLAAQTTSAFELVLVDDRSTDATAAIMERHRAAAPYPVRVVRNRQPPEDCTGKQQALDLGVAAAGGDLLLFTDADCTVPPTWVERLTAYFTADAGGRTGVVFGQLAVQAPGGSGIGFGGSGDGDRTEGAAARGPDRFTDRYQAFDQPLVHQYSTGTAGLGQPTGCFGNNLALRAPVLAGVGGFRSLGYTITEDAALIGAASRAGWKVRASTLAETLVTTEPQPDWRAFINQHVRWNGGAFYGNDPAAAWGYRYVTLFLILSVAAAPFALLVPWLVVWPLTSLVSIGTLAALAAALYHPRRRRALARVVPYTLFFMGFYAYITVLAIAGVRAEWKGSRLPATHAP